MRLTMSGKEIDRMPRLAFRVMKFFFYIRDIFIDMSKLLDEFGIKPGQTVVDIGCGPGSYVRHASALVGPNGRLFALDIHELAIEAVRKKAARNGLDNVTAMLTGNDNGYPLDDETADAVYALDMFHMVSDPRSFLQELNRITKSTGFLCIDNGHQPRQEARMKLLGSGLWEMVEEKKRYMKLRPIKKQMA
jgi:ubiquinone/menaquinone biosynthesis C-methylase UbiE